MKKKMKKIRHLHSASHLVYRIIKKMGRKREKKQISFLYFKTV
jgi:hypothetical protein